MTSAERQRLIQERAKAFEKYKRLTQQKADEWWGGYYTGTIDILDVLLGKRPDRRRK